jgi:hypothetical protein
MMAPYHNIRLSQILAGHPMREYKGESPVLVKKRNEQ